MKPIPDIDLSFSPLMSMLTAAIPARLLLTAIQLEIFTQLAQPQTAPMLAQRIKAHSENTRLILDALVANGLLRKCDGKYQNTSLANAFLVKNKPTYLGDVFLDDAEWMLAGLGHMTELIERGPPPSGRPPHSIDWPLEAKIRANCQRAGVAQKISRLVSQLPEFPRMKKMLDLGAGSGLIGLAIVAAHPTMTGVLFDRPVVIQVAQQFIREYELSDRVSTIGGDYTTDSLGDGYDLVWTSYALPHGALEPILQKIYTALKPDGVLLSLAEGLTHERTKPSEMINMMLATNLHAGKDTMFAEGEIARAMLHVGFHSVQSIRTDDEFPHGPAIIDVARKE